MGVKCNVTRSDEREEKPFPKLMSVGVTTLVVLFIEKNYGSVICGDQEFDIGYCNDDWDMSAFTDFEGTITLENE